MELNTHFANGTVFELLENALLAFVLAGVLWNVGAGHGLVAQSAVPARTTLTTLLVFATVSFDTVTGTS